jgi:hypothetical protein
VTSVRKRIACDRGRCGRTGVEPEQRQPPDRATSGSTALCVHCVRGHPQLTVPYAEPVDVRRAPARGVDEPTSASVRAAGHRLHLFDPDVYTVTPEPKWPCPHCGGMPIALPGLERWPELGADACLGVLPDVAQACCGHGARSIPYVVISPGCHPYQWVSELPDHVTLDGVEALELFRSMGVGPP